MGVRFCYASISETGGINGTVGDQTGKEVRCRNEYDFGQRWVIRCTDNKKRLRIASAARRFADNKNVGYGQSNRGGLAIQMRKHGWLISKISKIKKCNCDCSTLACCSVNAAYNEDYAPMLTTRTMPEWFAECEDFKVYEPKTLKGFKLKKGDLVGKPGHVVVVYAGGRSSF